MDGLQMKYFVLNPRSKNEFDAYALASRVAMQAYAKTIEIINPKMAEDLREWVAKEDQYLKQKWFKK